MHAVELAASVVAPMWQAQTHHTEAFQMGSCDSGSLRAVEQDLELVPPVLQKRTVGVRERKRRGNNCYEVPCLFLSRNAGTSFGTEGVSSHAPPPQLWLAALKKAGHLRVYLPDFAGFLLNVNH